MKMKTTNYILGILIILILPSLVFGAGFSPSNLVFNLKQNQENCQKVAITSDSQTITISDKWAENENQEWKVSSFNTDADSHELSIRYPNQLSINDREFQVCISGSKLGEYHGVLLLKQDQVGNSIVQMGIWLKVIISGENGNIPASTTPTTTTTPITTSISQIAETERETQTQETSTGTETNSITGAVVGGGSKMTYWILGFICVIVLVAAFIFYKRWRKKRWEMGY